MCLTRRRSEKEKEREKEEEKIEIFAVFVMAAEQKWIYPIPKYLPPVLLFSRCIIYML